MSLDPVFFPPALAAELAAEEERHTTAIVSLINRHPQYRVSLAYALLGAAIAVVDTFGGDAEELLREIRKRSPRPAVLAPPKGKQS